MIQLVEKHRPKKLADFAGLAGPRSVLSRFAADPYVSAWLLLGPPGTGKTTMALALADEIGGELHHIPSRRCDLETVEDVCAKCHYFPWTGKWHVVLVDEADQMSRAAQLAFLSKLDATAAPPQTIFLFTANATDLLEKRFLSRCRTIRFAGEVAPTVSFLERVWESEAPGRRPPNLRQIALDAEGNVRQALMELEVALMTDGDFPESEPETASAPVTAIDDLDSLGVRALRALCKQHDVPIASRKQEVVSRLRLAMATA